MFSGLASGPGSSLGMRLPLFPPTHRVDDRRRTDLGGAISFLSFAPPFLLPLSPTWHAVLLLVAAGQAGGVSSVTPSWMSECERFTLFVTNSSPKESQHRR